MKNFFVISISLLITYVSPTQIRTCPKEDGQFAVHIPHEDDCTKFYKCDKGAPILHDCKAGLHFNPTLEVCDWPQAAGCEPGTGTTTQSTGDCEGEQTTTCAGGTPPDENPNSVGECPKENGDFVVHLPHATDCSKFYKCNWGEAILHECPDGLHFNPTLQVCDWPENSGCDGSGGGGSGGGGGNDGTTANPEVGSSTSGGTSDGKCPAENEGDVVHLPHETDCTKFYKCDWGQAILQQCPGGLHFNPILQVCDWPENAGCDGNGGGSGGDGSGGGSGGGNDGTTADPDGNGDCNGSVTTEGCVTPEPTSTDSVGSSTSGGTSDGKCPTENEGDAVHLPHETDCTKFYKCDWGQAILQQCPGGLHFNPILQVCDWPENAGCDGNGGGSGGDGGGGSGGGNDGTTADPDGNGDCNGSVTTEGCVTPEPTSTDSVGSSTSGGTSDGKCPAENEGDVVHLPHETDCTKFYKCDWGQAIIQQCPGGLHFNPILQVCDWPENAGCDGNGGGSGGDGGGGSGGGNDGTTADPDGNGDCNGSVTTEGCVTPEPTSTDSVGSSTSGGTSDGKCPAENEGDAVHLPHETDCTKFYKCDWGQAILQQCPGGLHFNPILQVCDWPENAGCDGNDGGSGGGGGGGSGGGNDGTTADPDGNGDCNGSVTTEGCVTPEPTSTDSVGSSTSGGTSDGKCPAENEGDAVHLPHETDCTKFYKCDWGQAILQQCPGGLHFNPILQVCDWPENAGCDENGGGSGGGSGGGNDGTTADPDGSTDSVGSSTSGGTSDGKCPAENEGNAVHLPHETDCTKFYKCDWGQAILQQCPDGLHFNPLLQVCDWPEDAGCDPNGGNGGGEGTTIDSNDNGGCNGAATTEGCVTQGPTTTDNDSTSENQRGHCESLGCPPLNGKYVYFLPYPSDCTRFCQCDWGTPYEFICPPGLHFNTNLDVCDYPENAGCSP